MNSSGSGSQRPIRKLNDLSEAILNAGIFKNIGEENLDQNDVTVPSATVSIHRRPVTQTSLRASSIVRRSSPG